MSDTIIPVSDSILTNLVNTVISGGEHGITAILLIFLFYVIYEKHKLAKQFKEQEDENRKALREIIDKYYNSKIEDTKAFDSIMSVLAKIEYKL